MTTKEFKCPHCNEKIEDTLIKRFFASIGGAKSKRKTTSEEASRYANIRWDNERKKKAEREKDLSND